MAWIAKAMQMDNEAVHLCGMYNPEAKRETIKPESTNNGFAPVSYYHEDAMVIDACREPTKQKSFAARCAFCNEQISNAVFMYNDQQFCCQRHRSQAEALQRAQGESSFRRHRSPFASSASPYVDVDRAWRSHRWI